MDSSELFFKHIQEAEELLMISLNDGKITVFSSFPTESEAIELLTTAQEQLILKVVANRRKRMEDDAAEQTKKIIKDIDSKFH